MVRYRADMDLRDYRSNTDRPTEGYMNSAREEVPDTIKAIEEIRAGSVYSRVHKTQGKWIKERNSLYLAEKITGRWLDVKKYDLQGHVVSEDPISLADNGVVPYDSGIWNNANRLRYVAASLEEAIEVVGIMDRLRGLGFVE